MLLMQAVNTLVSAGLVAVSLGGGSVTWIYGLLGLGAISQALGTPSRSALLPQLVPVEDFSNAVTWNSSIFHLASMLGPAFGGLIIGLQRTSTAAFLLVFFCRLLSLAGIVFGLSPWFWLSLAMMFLLGALDNISVVVRHTLVQMLTPDVMRGRVSAVNSIFIVASNDLGGLESGVTAWALGLLAASSGLGGLESAAAAQALGAKASVVMGGMGAILVVLAASRIWPQLLALGSLQDLRPIEVEDERSGSRD